MAFYTDDWLASVKRDAFLTTAQGNFTDAQILAIGNDFLFSALIPLLMSEREGFFRESQDISFVASQADYTIPSTAMYGKLESVQYLSQGQILPMQLTRIEIENLGDVLPSLGSGTPRYFTLNSHAITVYPTPTTATDSMRVYFDKRPGTMILKASAAQVLSLNSITGVVTYTGTPPSGYTSSSTQDFYNGSSPYQLKRTATATAFSGSTQTFPVADVAYLAASDWVTPTGYTVFLPIPEELSPHLKDLVILSMARTQQDAELYNTQQREIVARVKATLSATGNRMPGNPKRVRLTNPLVRNRSVPRFR